METVSNLRVVLNREKNRYHVGDVIIGYVSFDMTGPMDASGIALKVNGKARLHWRDYTARDVTRVNCKMTIISEKIELLKNDATKDIRLNKGHHQIPFFFQLPQDLPNSLSAKRGYVRYWLQAVIHLPERAEQAVETSFYVGAFGAVRSQLSMLSNMERTAGMKKQFNWLRFAFGETQIHLALDRVFATAGERVSIIAECTNNSQVRMKRTKLRLMQVLLFEAGPSTAREKRSLVTLRGGGVEAMDTRSWHERRMIIPDCPPTGFPGLDCISVEYFIQFKVLPFGLSKSFHTAIRIIIGSRLSEDPLYAMTELETASSSSG